MSREAKYITVCDRYGRQHMCETPTGPVPPGHRPATDKQIMIAQHMSVLLGIDVPAADSTSIYSTFISNNMPNYSRKLKDRRACNVSRKHWIPRGEWPNDTEFDEGWGLEPEY